MAMATMQSPRSSDFVYVTVEAGWVEGSLNTSGLEPTIANLEYSLDLNYRLLDQSKYCPSRQATSRYKNIGPTEPIHWTYRTQLGAFLVSTYYEHYVYNMFALLNKVVF